MKLLRKLLSYVFVVAAITLLITSFYSAIKIELSAKAPVLLGPMIHTTFTEDISQEIQSELALYALILNRSLVYAICSVTCGLMALFFRQSSHE